MTTPDGAAARSHADLLQSCSNRQFTTSTTATSHTTRCTKLSIPAVLRPCNAWQLTIAVKTRVWWGNPAQGTRPDGEPRQPCVAVGSIRPGNLDCHQYVLPGAPPGAHAQGPDQVMFAGATADPPGTHAQGPDRLSRRGVKPRPSAPTKTTLRTVTGLRTIPAR